MFYSEYSYACARGMVQYVGGCGHVLCHSIVWCVKGLMTSDFH